MKTSFDAYHLLLCGCELPTHTLSHLFIRVV